MIDEDDYNFGDYDEDPFETYLDEVMDSYFYLKRKNKLSLKVAS